MAIEGYEGFRKMLEIDKHIQKEIEQWKSEGMDPHTIATVLSSLARRIDPTPVPLQQTWSEQWRSSPGYKRAIDYIHGLP